MVTYIPSSRRRSESYFYDFGFVNASSDEFLKLLDGSSVLNNREGQVVDGIVSSIGDKNAIIDIGMKTEGRVSLEEFSLETSDGKGPDIKEGSVVRVYIERMEGRDGYVLLSREKAVREEKWAEIKDALETGKSLEGTIVLKTKGGFLVNISGAVAFLPSSQLDVKMVKDPSSYVGTTHQFKVLRAVRKRGPSFVVSRRAILENSRDKVRKKLLDTINEGDVVEGVIKNLTEYGAFIDLGGIDGLLHVTDISWKRISHPSEVLSIGQKVKVKIIRFNKDNKRISLGMKQIEENPWVGLSSKYPVGSRHFGTVVNLTEYGAFVELEEGIEGLIYVSEIGWLRFNNNPRNLLSKGQKVEVEVLSIDEEKNKISLSIKRCTPNPWAAFADVHSCGDILDSTVRHITDFGIFVGFDNKQVDGLAHICDLTWNDNPDKELFKYKKGDRLKVKVLSINAEKERISVGVKQIDSDPMEDALKSTVIGSEVDCVVSGERDGDIVATLSKGVEGILKAEHFAIPASSADDGSEGPAYKYPAQDEKLRARVVEIEPKKRAIYLAPIVNGDNASVSSD